jgi:hypothetical protein
MKVFASFFKKKRCLSLSRGRPTNPARFFFVNREPGAKNQKTFMTYSA